MKTYSLIESEKEFITQGLYDLIGKEFLINKKSLLKSDVEIIVDYIVKYIEEENKQIKDLETFGCGSWLIQFVFKDIYIELHELKNVVNGSNYYEFDLTQTIKLYKEQLHLCIDNKVEPVVPLIGQKIAVSKEIYEGREVNGVRYRAPSHMTGWYLTSNSFDGNVNSLIVDHLYHILTKRPDLAKYLALPSGYRFYKDDKEEEVWFDQKVLNS